MMIHFSPNSAFNTVAMRFSTTTILDRSLPQVRGNSSIIRAGV